ncbi:ABC transporter ATP-binding protein [Egibacter rhizosphaerae]|uniref:ABC transporter ATP-binding protein n=1 Tax=Egibacter rhizosphaerae TaxID=1670831 RepID=A0A411YI28_9ACTN|nr:ABC transporter ATP-binding protein [Egibacter rhizosphaerae]QBI20890.1 ABC transporter ATP-binding protein [Egibacter rhizosphaerae]
MSDSAPLLQMQDVVAGYSDSDLVLNHVTLEAAPGKVTAVLGPNGSGKSTSLRVLYGFLSPREGRILLDGSDITETSPQERLELGISLLPQGRSTFPEMTVEENLELGGWLWRHDRARLRRAVEDTFERYPKLADLRKRHAGSLSGGQQRILEIARTLILDPSVLLIDEPSVGLAPVLVNEVYQDLEALKDDGRTILLVDQNVQAAAHLADYIYTLAYGKNDVHGDTEAFEGQLGDVIRSWLRI